MFLNFQMLIHYVVCSFAYLFFKSYFEHNLKCHSCQVPHLIRPRSYLSKRSPEFRLRRQRHILPETCPCGQGHKGGTTPVGNSFFLRKVRRGENRAWHDSGQTRPATARPCGRHVIQRSQPRPVRPAPRPLACAARLSPVFSKVSVLLGQRGFLRIFRTPGSPWRCFTKSSVVSELFTAAPPFYYFLQKK